MAEAKKKPGRPAKSKENTKTSAKKSTKSNKDTSAAAAATKKIATGNRVKDEIFSIIIIAVGIFFAVAMQTQAAGEFGLVIKNFFSGCFGKIAVVLPYYMILYGALLLFKKTTHINKRSVILLTLTFLMFSIIYSAPFVETDKISFAYFDLPAWIKAGIAYEGGGALGMLFAVLVMVAVGPTGLYIFAILTIIVCMMLIINTPISQFMEDHKTKKAVKKLLAEEAAIQEAEESEQRQKQMEMDLRSAYAEKAKKEQLSASKANDDGSIGPIIKQAKDNEKKINILGYMKDNSLFGGRHKAEGEHDAKTKDKVVSNETSSKTEEVAKPTEQVVKQEEKAPEVKISYGLEEITPVRAGFGLCDTPVETFATEKSVSAAETVSDIAEPIVTTVRKSEPVNYGMQDKPKQESVRANYGSPEGVSTVPNRANTFVKASDYSSSEKVHEVKGRPTEGVQQMQTKLSKSEAENARLSEDDFNKNAENLVKYEFPSIEFLNKGKANVRDLEHEHALKAKAAKLEKTLQDFKVNAKVVNVTEGPAVTRYEIQPNVGVKVSSIVRLADDIALNLEAKSIRIEAPIPGKAAVGIEVENEKINMVTAREIIESKEFKASESKITFAVGKDIAGQAIVADLKSMPHLLIAGSTGSGKSVCINSIIISILYKAKPDEVKFVLIDPKVVELGNYNGIPHMLIPVVTEPSKAAAALNWAVAEMNDRYKKFAEEGVRDLAGYNEQVKFRDEHDKVLPQIVIIIDELADLMMAAPSQVEESICRLAQMARAAGMHLIVATQRPSVDVITGVIKANIPSRIAFAVSSQFDSRTILDMAGAEKLVGKGDMLFNPLGSGKPIRVQGNFISDSEVHTVIEHLKKQCVPNNSQNEILSNIEAASNKTSDINDDGDELLAEAIETVVRAQQASVSMLQRRFRIGYNRAARIVDMMEARGIIGPADGSRPRQVLMTLEEFLGVKEEGEQVVMDMESCEEVSEVESYESDSQEEM